MTNVTLIKNVLDALKSLKASIRDTAEPSVIAEIDKLITELEILLENEDAELSKKQLLKKIGWLIEKLPSIIDLMSLFSG